MDVKLTLTLDREVIVKAKQFASESSRSLSDLVETYLKTLISKDEAASEEKISPLVSSLLGSIRVPEDFDYTEELKSALQKKYK